MSWLAAAPAALSFGQSLGEKISGGNDTNTGTYAGDTAANIALDAYNSSQGIRGKTFSDLYDFLWGPQDQGGYDPTASPVFQAGRNVLEDQYSVAKDNIISSMPKGGQLSDELADIEMGRAKSIGGLAGQVSQDMWDKAFSTSTGTPLTSSQNTLTGIAGSEAMLNAQKSAQKDRAMSDLGYALGQMDW